VTDAHVEEEQHLPRLVAIAIVVGGLIGALTVVGWLAGVPVLQAPFAGNLSMKLNTGLCVLALATAELAFAAGRSKSYQGLGLVALAVGAGGVVEHVFGWSLGIDQLVVSDVQHPALAHPGRMAPVAAATIVVVALSLLARARRRGLAEVLAGAATITSLVVVIAYAYGVAPLPGAGEATPIAPQTAVALLALAVGALALARHRVLHLVTGTRPGSIAGRRILIVGMLVVPILGWLRILGSNAGLYSDAMGPAVLVVAFLIVFGGVVLWTIRGLDAAAAEQQRAGERMSAIFAASPVPTVISRLADGMIRLANPACLEMLGWEAHDFVGRTTRDVCLWAQPELRSSMVEQLCGEGRIRDMEVDIRKKSGKTITVLATMSRISLGHEQCLVGAFYDITERHLLEAQVRESEARFRLIAENSRDLIRLYDPDAVIRYASPSCRAVLGYDAHELVGRQSTDFQHPDDAAGHDERRRAVIASSSDSTVTYQSRRKDGSYVWLESTVRPRYDEESGALVGFQETSRDITERKHGEGLVRRAKEEAEQANSAKSEFLSRMSHELRTPLHAILGFGELLEREALKPAQRDKLLQITKGGRHLLTLINEVLDLARIERGDLSLSLEPVHVGELVQETLDMVTPLAAARSVTIRAPAPDSLDTHVLADRHRLKQVLLNLMSNAVKYNRTGGEVALAFAPTSSANVRIDVADSGAGIAAADLVRVFDPFERLGAEASDVEGTGLGLALSKRLVEAMNGEIGVESELGNGTTFWLDLPSAMAPQMRREPSDSDLATVIPRSRGLARTVLYVEDNPSNIKLAETILAERPEVSLIVATQGGLALELARQHRPALALLDLNLPDISGEEVLRRMRADPRTADIPIVVVSADATPGQVERLLAAGANDYLTKPFTVARFLAVIDGSEPADAANGNGPGTVGGLLDPGAIQALHDLASRPAVGASAVRDLVRIFLTDALDRQLALETAVGENDLGGVTREAHALRGASGGVGAAEVTRLCRELETGANQADAELVRSLVPTLGEALVDVSAALEVEFDLLEVDGTPA
jgi:PAS domain S-box-containing protein